MNQTAGHYSDALVDYSGLSKTLGDLGHSFSLLEFLDLCAVLEGIVLHDRLVVVGGDSLVSGPLDTQPHQQSVPSRQTLPGVVRSQGMERWRSLVKPLVDAGVLVAAPRTRPGNAGPKPADSAGERGFNVRAHLSRGSAPMIARSTELDSWYEAGRLIGAEQDLGCPPSPSSDNVHFMSGVAKPRLGTPYVTSWVGIKTWRPHLANCDHEHGSLWPHFLRCRSLRCR